MTRRNIQICQPWLFIYMLCVTEHSNWLWVSEEPWWGAKQWHGLFSEKRMNPSPSWKSNVSIFFSERTLPSASGWLKYPGKHPSLTKTTMTALNSIQNSLILRYSSNKAREFHGLYTWFQFLFLEQSFWRLWVMTSKWCRDLGLINPESSEPSALGIWLYEEIARRQQSRERPGQVENEMLRMKSRWFTHGVPFLVCHNRWPHMRGRVWVWIPPLLLCYL